MACCTNLADFCRRVGIADLFRREPEVVFLGPGGTRLAAQGRPGAGAVSSCRQLPAANYLTWTDKLRVAYGLACLALGHGDRPGESFADWLLRHRQSPRSINLFWSTVLVSALNERLDQMDVNHARKVLVGGFLSNRTGFEMEIPLVPLGVLYGSRLMTWLETTGSRSASPRPSGRSISTRMMPCGRDSPIR